MNKARFETPNLTAENVAKIAELFPGVVTEGKVNFDLLRSMLGEDVYQDEAYEFTWVGKRAAIAEAGRPIRKTLRPCVEESKDWDTTENLYIEGDNLDVLKLLQESYLGKIKMIYIDPPYNTGNEFVYRDDFTVDKDEYDEESGVFDEGGERLFRNTETNGRFHSDWCSMIYPRLVLSRNMLSHDGVIFISIDDNEVGQLRKICDEVFGAVNFICNAIWEKKFSPQNDAKWFSDNHDHIMIYAKSKNEWFPKKLERTEESNTRFTNPDNDPRGAWASSDMTVRTYNADYDYPITTPSGREVMPTQGRCWSMPRRRVEELIADNRIWFGKDGNNVPRIKTFLSEVADSGIVPLTIWKYGDVGHNQEARQELKKLFDDAGYFDSPKPVRLLYRILNLASDSDSIILDFFSGSATAAHAVMQLNAEDGGNRKFIMVQLPEVCAEGTEAAKAGYKNICEIGKERIRRAGDKIVNALRTNPEMNQMTMNDTVGADLCVCPPTNSDITESGGHAGPPLRKTTTSMTLDIGFRVLKLDDTNMTDVYYAASDYTQDLVLQMESNIKPDRTDMDLLYGCLLDWGLPLSMPHTHEELDGFTIHTYNDGDLIACFEEHISEKTIRDIAERKPLRAVFRDSSFTSSPEKINVFEIFKLLAPNTNVRVI